MFGLKIQISWYNKIMTKKDILKKYPFLKIRNAMTGKIQPGEKNTYLDWIPTGWRKAFGDSFVDELSVALGKDAKNYRILDVKEKFGGLRWYDGNGTEASHRVVDKYERLSYFTCINCGDPATKISKGWICPYCDQCAKVLQEELEHLDFVPIEEYYKKYDHEMIEEEE